MKLFVKCILGDKDVIEVHVHPIISVNEFKWTVLAPKLRWHPDNIALGFGVTNLEGDNTLESYGIEEGSTLRWIQHKNFRWNFLPWPPKDEPQPSRSSVDLSDRQGETVAATARPPR